ncbi:uncharacterized protein GGS22DRAFT_155102 [Annulohypoxylon maeteangense]|uniref:uncharacterized protein n=1 Tax=Annulohypoxylon maeteangense TaxID=1927788 RepID=UPI002008E18F|nr:uncharacterized protein GGS22DRAFT_155102 [Annulohypoxylon maeteangense]KAI0888111.1 hypothetical protein GGS22DRAFT_155102 [Annulohypoxylon maeteangense]
MQSSSSHGSGSRSSRSTGEEPKRRKRYSLRIEFLDDDDDIEFERSREAARQQRRSEQGFASSPRASNGRPENPRETSQRSRQASVSSTAAAIGTGNRRVSAPMSARPPSARGRYEGTRSHASHTGQREENPTPTVEQLTQDFDRHMTVQDRSDSDLPSRFQRQMSLRHSPPPPNPHRDRKPSRKHAYTQTDLRGLGWSTLNLSHRPATPIPAFLHAHSSPTTHDHRTIEAVYREGFEAGQRSAASPLIPARAPWPDIRAPRPVTQQPTPERTMSSSVPPPSAGNRSSASRSRAQSRERREQPCHLKRLIRGWREP